MCRLLWARIDKTYVAGLSRPVAGQRFRAVEHDLQRASIARFWAATCVDKAVLAAVLNLQFHFCRRFCQLQLHAVGFGGRKRFGCFVYLQKSVAVQADQIYCGRLDGVGGGNRQRVGIRRFRRFLSSGRGAGCYSKSMIALNFNF